MFIGARGMLKQTIFVLGYPRKNFDKKSTMQHDKFAERSKQKAGGAAAVPLVGGGDDMNFRILDIGQFADISVDFGDLTLLVGAQGTGKSIFLQLFKLSQDQKYVKNTMNQFGQDWNMKSRPGLMAAYFGEGMNHIWRPQSRILRDGRDAAPSPRMPVKEKNYAETVYYIPAQRVLTMLTGWPQPYRSYTPRDPFYCEKFQRAYTPVP